MRIYEITHDWEQAVETFRELEKVDAELVQAGQIAHYYCELAEQVAQDRDFSQARELLKKAGSDRRGTVRARLILADLARQVGDHKEAVKVYRSVMDAEPRLIGEVIPRLAESCRALDNQALLTDSLKKLCKKEPLASKAIALAAIHDGNIQNQIALDCLRDYIAEDRILAQLVDVDSMRQSDGQKPDEILQRVRAGLAALISSTHRYRCNECGYITSQLLWQCPSCRCWETVVPVEQLSLTSPIS